LVVAFIIYIYNKMSQAAIIGAVLPNDDVILISAAMLMMGGDDEKKTGKRPQVHRPHLLPQTPVLVSQTIVSLQVFPSSAYEKF
jgi:hypothetical protein